MFKILNLRKILIGVTAAAAAITAIRCCLMITTKAQPAKENEKPSHDGILLPIIMYHSILKDESKAGDYIISARSLEEDFAYLKREGYTSVFVNDVIRYVNYGGELPEKPIILSFDDGSYNNLVYLEPLLEKYGFKATLSIVGDFTTAASESADAPDPAYSYLSWQNINEMRKSGRYEFCSHTNSMHGLEGRMGVLRREDESRETYRRAFLNDALALQKLFEENCGFMPNTFTYPYGFRNEEAEELVFACGFEASLAVGDKPNYIIKGSSECLYDLERVNRSGLDSTEDFMLKFLSIN